MPRCTACIQDGTRCSNDVNIVLRNLPRDVQRELHKATVQHCRARPRECCQVCTTHAKQAFRERYGPLLVAKGVDVANMAFLTMMELLTCKGFRMDGGSCEEFWTGAQGVSERWGV